jgi:flagellar protein FlaF
MTLEAYEDVTEDSNVEARGRERRALSLGIDQLEKLQTGVSHRERIESLLYIRRLWATFIEDLASPDNALPEKLRADIISIGIWVLREADRLLAEKSNDMVQLIDINRLIRDAL